MYCAELPPGDNNPLSGGAIAGIVLAVLLLIAAIAVIVYLKVKHNKKERLERQYRANRLPNYLANTGPSPVSLYAPGAEGGDVKINPFGRGVQDLQIPEKQDRFEQPPPVYGMDPTAPTDILDSRNNMFSPPPPYAPEDDAVEERRNGDNTMGGSNPVYDYGERMASVD